MTGSNSDAPDADRGVSIGLLALLALAAGVQVWFALDKGLVLDEFHSHYHATQPSWGLFWTKLLDDNHPPLSFLLISGSAKVFGDSELALRLPAMLFALIEIVLVWRLARDHGRAPAFFAAALLAASSLHLDFATQARMYALHSLAVTGCAVSILRLLHGDGGLRTSLGLGLWFWIGLHNHYFFVQYAGGLGLGALLAAWLEPLARQRFRSLVFPIGIALVFAAPWYLFGFRIQWGHALSPGGDDVGLMSLIEAYVHLFFLNVRLGSSLPLVGGILREVFIACGAILTVLALLGAWWGMARTESPRTRCATVLMASIAFVVPCTAVLLAALLPRAGFTWHYVLPSAAAEAWLIGLAWRRGGFRLVRPLVLIALLAATGLSLLNARSRGTEDFPGAVASILAQHQPGDVIVSVEWQPSLFPQGMPWDYYAPRLATTPPQRLPMNQTFSVLDPTAFRGVPRVLILKTSLPPGAHLFRLLAQEGLNEVRREPYGFGPEVLVFER